MGRKLTNYQKFSWYIRYMNNPLPLIAIDFDGVFNPFGILDGTAHDFGLNLEKVSIPLATGPAITHMEVQVNRDHISIFNSFQRDRQAEIVWLTTWAEDTELFPEYLGFLPLEWIPDIPDPEWYLKRAADEDWWKLRAMKKLRHEQPSRKILWIDDELQTEPDSLLWAEENDVEIIAPKSWKGLSSSDFAAINLFIHSS